MPPAAIKTKQSPIIAIAIILAGLAGGYLYYAQVQSGASPIPPSAISVTDSLAKFKELQFNFSIFDDPRFKSLKIFGESPVQPGPTGRTDIFAPF